MERILGYIKEYFFALAFFAILIMMLIGFADNSSSKDAAPAGVLNGDVNPLAHEVYWETALEKGDSYKVYEAYKERYRDESFGVQHSMAHIMGELLYERMGLEGLSVCDSTFAFGCYHSFFGRAISEEGIEIVGELNSVCLEKFGEFGTGCQHGIGHGIFEYFGVEGIVDALKTCATVNSANQYFGCYTGVFMEYNTPTIIDSLDSFPEPRAFDATHPYEPCNTTIPTLFKKACYHELTLWWSQVLREKSDTIEQIGRYCEDVPEPEYKESCYVGIGYTVAGILNYDVSASIEACGHMPTEEGEMLCRASTSWAFFSVPEKRESAPLLCEGFDDAKRYHCIEKSDLIGNGEIKNL